LVDQINAEITVHRFVTQDILVLLCCTRHLVLATQRQDLGESHVEEQTFHQARKHNQRLQQSLICLRSTCMEVGVHDGIDEGNQELVFVADRFNFVVRVKNFAFVKPQGLHNVLVSVGVNRLFKSLTRHAGAVMWR
jgi:hypothetical protein